MSDERIRLKLKAAGYARTVTAVSGLEARQGRPVSRDAGRSWLRNEWLLGRVTWESRPAMAFGWSDAVEFQEEDASASAKTFSGEVPES